MRLLERLGLAIAGVFAVYAAIDFAIQHRVVYPGFEALEKREAQEDVERVAQAIEAELEHLDGLCHDWAAWDDTVRFVHEHDQAYVESTLQPATLDNAELAVVLFADRSGRVVDRRYSTAFAAEGCEAPEYPADQRAPSHPLHVIGSARDRKLGLVATPCGILLVAARPIVPSDESGEPCGSLLMARRLDSSRVRALCAQTRVRFDLVRIDGGATLGQERSAAAVELLGGERFATESKDEGDRLGWALLRDYRGEPLALVEATIPREISAQGRRVVDYAQLSLIAAGLGVLFATRLLLKHIVVTPLERVSAHAVRIGDGDALHERLASERTDEIGQLSRALDSMVGHLSESRTRLLRVAHLAGRSEVATEVLHNVGSVLTSTTVAAQQVEARVRSSRSADVERLAELLHAHEHDLGAFLATDPRGVRVPEFLTLLGKSLAAERAAVLAECETLNQSLDHVRTLVQEQQKHAGSAALLEPVDVEAMVELALRLAPASSAPGVRVERRFAALGPIPVAKHRLLEILVNLIKNARESIETAGPTDPCLVLTVERAGPERVRIVVRDNGLGIAKEDLTRIFSHGFTTKADGHGFGLHSCANAARELGGSLRAESDGPGCGASFVLELPAPTAVATEALAA